MIKKYIQKTLVITGLAAILGFTTMTVLPASSYALASSVKSFAAAECSSDECKSLYTKYLNPMIRLLSAVVGVLVVFMIVVGGIEYSSAGSDPQQITEARNKIRNAVIGLLSYIFLFAFLNWLIPGGIV